MVFICIGHAKQLNCIVMTLGMPFFIDFSETHKNYALERLFNEQMSVILFFVIIFSSSK